MPPRESFDHQLQKEWREGVLSRLDSAETRLSKSELDMAVFKAKWSVVMALIGFLSSLVGSALIRYLFH
jgi:hypothetical protein